ncbi:hypothetical protein GCM10022248_82830 [Nonomuraea soli]
MLPENAGETFGRSPYLLASAADALGAGGEAVLRRFAVEGLHSIGYQFLVHKHECESSEYVGGHCLRWVRPANGRRARRGVPGAFQLPARALAPAVLFRAWLQLLR